MNSPTALARSFVLSIHRVTGDGRKHLAHLRAASCETGWDELLELLEPFARDEGPAATRRLMEFVAVHHSLLVGLGELLGDVRQSYVALADLGARQEAVQVDTSATARGFEVTLTLRRGFRPSKVFFQSCAWFLAAVPRLRGLDDARVKVERLTDRELKCRVIPPRDAAPHLGHPDATMKQLAHTTLRAHLGTDGPALEHRFGLTQAESRVVSRLAQGQSIKQLAQHLDISPETARTHVKRAMQKTATHRQAELVSLVLSDDVSA
ncbi:MAG: helix-turn-helix transcriptional regulator [Myxococcaceae bacterium]